MTVRTKVIGRLPQNKREWDPNYVNPSTGQQGYGLKFRVFQYGCELESKIENNTYEPFSWDGDQTFVLDVSHWELCSGNPKVWAAGNPKPATTGTTGDYPYNGMGRVVIPKNMVNIAEQGDPENIVNLLAQEAFEDGEGNPLTDTVFVIQYDFVLGENIAVPDNCVLEFDGGSISAGSGENMDTITGANTGINAGLVKIFNTDVTLAGSWNVAEAYPEWFGAKGDGITDDTNAILCSTKINSDSGIKVKFCRKQYLIKPDILDINRSNIELDGNGTVLKTEETSVNYDFLVCAHLGQTNIIIKNFTFNTLNDDYQSVSGPIGSKIIKIDSNDSYISNCTFYLYNTWAIIASNIYSRNITINDNKVYFSRNDVSYNYDCSAIYIQALSFNISNNIIDGSYNNNGFILRGGIEAHGQGYIVSNNTVRNTIAGINVIPHHNDVTISNIGYGKLISENNLDGVKYGIRIYTVKELSDLQISNNNITLLGGSVENNGIVRYNTDGDAILRNVLISGNTINNIERVTGISSLNNFTCGIRFDGDNIQNISIIDNVFSNISHHAIFISNNGYTEGGSNIRYISIINNTFDECGNGSYVANHQNYMYLDNVTALDISHNKYNNENYGYINEIARMQGCKKITIVDNSLASNSSKSFVMDYYIVDSWIEVRTNQLGLSWLKDEYPDSFMCGIKCKTTKTGSFNVGDIFLGNTKEIASKGGTLKSISSTGITSASVNRINVYSTANFTIGDYVKSSGSDIEVFVCGKADTVLFVNKDATGMNGGLNVVEPVFTVLN